MQRKMIGDLTVEYSDNLEYINHNKVNENELNIEFKSNDGNRGDVYIIYDKDPNYVMLNKPNPQDCDYYFTSLEDFKTRIQSICEENNNDLITKTFGFSDDITELNATNNQTPLLPPSVISTPKHLIGNNITRIFGFAVNSTALTKYSEELLKYLPKLKEVNGLFIKCVNLNTIYENLFKYNLEAVAFHQSLRWSQFTDPVVPENLFRSNIQLTNVTGFFADTNINDIPIDIFKNNINLSLITVLLQNTKITHLKNILYNNNLITNAYVAFGKSNTINSIDPNLLKNKLKCNNISGLFNLNAALINLDSNFFKDLKPENITNISYIFASSGITSIDKEWFSHLTHIKDYTSAFYGTSILEIPESLFSNLLIDNVNLSGTFKNCALLTSIPENLITQNISDVRQTFMGCTSITSNVPDLWNKEKYPNITQYGKCFNGCTNAANYNDIPDDWK